MTYVIQEGVIAPGEMLAIQLVENLIREDLKPIEQAKAYRSLMELNGWSARQVARELAIDHTGVTRALALLELPESVQSQVEQGTLPSATAYEVSKLEDAEQQREVAALVVQDGLSRAEAVEHVRKVAKVPKKGKGGDQGRPAEASHIPPGRRQGHPRAEPSRAEPSRAEPSRAEPSRAEPKRAGGVEGLLAMAREVVESLEAELGMRAHDAA